MRDEFLEWLNKSIEDIHKRLDSKEYEEPARLTGRYESLIIVKVKYEETKGRWEMFLTRVAQIKEGFSTLNTSVLHIAENRMTTLCRRYTPAHQINDEEIYSELGGMTLKEYLKMLCNNNKIENNICRLCLDKYKKDTIYT